MENDNRQAAEQTLAGAPKMGWFCSYTPLEILYAAGFMPVRITGHSDTIKKADAYMHPNLCQYARSCLDAAMEGQYGHLSGAVFMNSCDTMRRLYDVWKRYADADFTFIADLPKGQTDNDVKYLRNEFEKLRRALESHFKIEVPDAVIKQAVKVLARSRSLFHELSALRYDDEPRMTGAELAQMAQLFFSTRADVWNQTAEAMLKQKKAAAPEARAPRPRVVLSGSPAHNPGIISFIEDCGLDVVDEDMCSGGRFFALEVDNTVDVLTDLARAYLNRAPCARMMRLPDRVQYITAAAQASGARGVVHYALKFCDTYLYDAPELKKHLTDAGLRTLFLEGDGTLGGLGQLKTRIEAFAEVLGDE